jgi:hypothetical protein
VLGYAVVLDVEDTAGCARGGESLEHVGALVCVDLPQWTAQHPEIDARDARFARWRWNSDHAPRGRLFRVTPASITELLRPKRGELELFDEVMRDYAFGAAPVAQARGDVVSSRWGGASPVRSA